MAEAILKQLIAERSDAEQWQIESAGTWAIHGSPPAVFSQFVLQSMGIDIHLHRSQPVSQELMQQSDLILTMENLHKETLAFQFPQFADRIYMISEMVGLMADIPDPMGGDLAGYEETARELKRILSDGLDRIIQLALQKPG
jgi:protein-tyrosine-phosphatase